MAQKLGRWFQIALILLVLLLVLLWSSHKANMPDPPAVSSSMLEQAKRVKIIRDRWGVPHIFGKSDADAAFGLAFAHAEDDFRTIQLVLAASVGKLSLRMLTTQAIGNDFYVSFIRAKDQVKEHYEKLSPQTRALLKGYSQGLNYYAALHPHKVDGRLFPVSGKTIAQGFIHKLPLMFNLPRVLGTLRSAKSKKVGDPVFKKTATHHQTPHQRRLASLLHSFAGTGSNAHGVHRSRFKDDVTRLNVNSHQPWEGPVAWYEVHVHSEEGWDATGGLFPGAPFILHGHNAHLGWAMTVNKPDVVDVFKLKMHPKKPLSYKLDGKWKKLEKRPVNIRVDTGFFHLPLKLETFWSEHGPVFKTEHGYYALRYAGIGKAIYSLEQWYKMNKATNLKEWKAAMRIHALPMFNLVYADYNNVLYVYNALIPKRKPGFDYKKILPGDRSDLIWKTYIPWDKLPIIHNPPSGFVQNCNATPFHGTKGKGNPDPSTFPKEAGIEQKNNNRSMRSLALLGNTSQKLTHADFLKMKFDLFYAQNAPMMKTIVKPLLKSFKAETETEKKGLAMLRKWKRSTHMDNRTAALVNLTYHARKWGLGKKRRKNKKKLDVKRAFRQALSFLKKHYGRIDPKLGEVQRLRRGKMDLPVSGGPDVLRAVHSKLRGKHLVGVQGDSYILIAEFGKKGVRSHSRHQYGNSNIRGSKHYHDQAKAFTKQSFKPTLRDKKKLMAQKERAYHPGEKKKQKRWW